ncbi:hypothetical protein [Solibacillus sp. FSL W7-1324]|uniref:hypothetical protein n=1 Tax=Solibacillus sp. FSL W7-1324 TaxID=2921701 RepID=UPI0030F89280
MQFFSQLKINGLLLDVQGYFQTKMNILEIHCMEVISLFRNWKYEEVIVEELAFIDKEQTIYLDSANLVIAEVSHNQIKFIHI